ncbi:MAG: hypothetical protein WD079_05990, partial [Phycisphaeraceae bacterium]
MAVPAEVLTVLGLPTTAPFLDAIQEWLSGIACVDRRGLAAQIFLELRVGCWASPHMYGAAPFAVNLTPFCHRTIYETMLRLPVRYWGQHRLPHDIVRSQWPELAAVPFGRAPGVAGTLRHIHKRIKGRLRQRAGSA